MAPLEAEEQAAEPAGGDLVPAAPPAPAAPKRLGHIPDGEVEDWVNHVDEVSEQIRGIIDGTITDFDAFDRQLDLKERAKQIREEELKARRERFYLYGIEGKGEGTQYKWWCKRCFVEYTIDLPENKCTRCKQSDQLMTQQARRDELMGKLDTFKQDKAKHQWRKDKWLRWKKSQALLGRSRNINYKTWEYWEPDTDTEEEGEPILPRHNPEFVAMEADLKARHKKVSEKAKTAEKCRQRGNQCMKEGDYTGAIENYEEGLEYRRDAKALWTNKALAELKVFRWRDAIESCNKVIEYSEIFEDGFKKSADACFKAFVRRALALRALHKWAEALADLEDALKLFPNDREARDLYEKTKAADEEAQQLQSLQEAPAAEPAPAAGPVRVEIEESEDEEDAEALQAVPKAHANSLAGLSKQEFASLMARLKRDQSERVLFCARPGSEADTASDTKQEGRKIKLKAVEAVEEPSGLDSVLRDAERCCVLWKKSQGNVVPLREDVKHMMPPQEKETAEDKEAAAFLRVVAPRLVLVLHTLATCSDHHCALTAPAVRHIWPLLCCPTWRHSILELLAEWSQRSISAKAMAEFAGRYPEPHLRLLMEVLREDAGSKGLPPQLQECMEQASRHLDGDEKGIDAAIDEMLKGLSVLTPTELAASTLGNLCLAGHNVPAFKEQLAPLQGELVASFRKHLQPANWRLCSRAAGALCNVLRLGDAFACTVQEECLEAIVTALREECKHDGPASMLRGLCQGGSNGFLPLAGSSAQLLGALVNLLVVRPTAMPAVLQLGVLDLVLPLINPEAEIPAEGGAAEGDLGPATLSSRAALLASKLLGAAPAELSIQAEAELLRRLFRMLERGGDFSAVRAGEGGALEMLDLAVRMVTIVLTKTPGALDRLTEAAPRIEELPDDGVTAPLSRAAPAVPFSELGARLLQLALAAEPEHHVGLGAEGTYPSRIRGNLALLFGALAEAQAKDGAPPALRELDLSPTVGAFIGCLRKERGKVQHNAGVCVTKLAQNPRYRQQVRDLNGIESLHQIQLPVVEVQKAGEARRHRIETSVEARRTEAARLQQLRSFRGLD